MARAKSARSPTASSLSGPLSHALPRHAERRASHFFQFLFFLEAASDVVFGATGHHAHPADLLQEAATHQIDSGLRGDGGRGAFDTDDPAVVDMNATSFRNIDAAHYCNLGLAGGYSGLKRLANQDEGARDLIEMCETLAGDTVWLPQQINLGPDREIDQLHYRLARRFLEQDGPAFTDANVSSYAVESDMLLCAYASKKDREGAHGLAACARCYLAPYSNLNGIIFQPVEDEIRAECRARDLDPARYIGA